MNKWKDDGEFVKQLKFLIHGCSQKMDEFLKQSKEKPSRYYLEYQKTLHLI